MLKTGLARGTDTVQKAEIRYFGKRGLLMASMSIFPKFNLQNDSLPTVICVMLRMTSAHEDPGLSLLYISRLTAETALQGHTSTPMSPVRKQVYTKTSHLPEVTTGLSTRAEASF